jgi:hypothetical protein
MTSVPFAQLSAADLVIDATYESNRDDPLVRYGSDPLTKLLPGIGNAGGFRIRVNGPKLVGLVLTSTGGESEWPDNLNNFDGTYTYYGDNRKPGADLHETKAGGNRRLRELFAIAHGGGAERSKCPLILVFHAGDRGKDVVFKGLAVPGARHLGPGDDLVAVWRMSGGKRFQNYRATFTILDTGTVSGDWVRSVLANRHLDWCDSRVPSVLLDWVETGKYSPLVTERPAQVRSIEDQTPIGKIGKDLVACILEFCEEDKYLFEPIAAALWQMRCSQPVEMQLTRRHRDGGRDAIGFMSLGPDADAVPISFSLEAKCYAPHSRVGVKEMSRLISRLRHREFGVLVTTSVVDRQAYQEIRTDGHPIVVMCGRDIAETLIENGITTRGQCLEWIESWMTHFEIVI